MSTATDSSRNGSSSINNFKHAAPIPILDPVRRRRPSSSSSSSSGSPTSPPAIQTPTSYHQTGLAPSSPTNSSLISYIMSTSPKTAASFPCRRPPGFGTSPVFEDDEGQEIEYRSSRDLHQRRATTGWAGNGRTPPSPTRATGLNPPVIEAQQARGAGVLRRLSLGGGLGGSFFQNTVNNGPPSPPQPTTPPPSAVTPSPASGFAAAQANTETRTRVRRSATLSVPTGDPRRRAPSPMGERILKGHFDGFN